MLKNVSTVTLVIWTRISSQQTQVLKRIVQQKLSWLEMVEMDQSEIWRDTHVFAK